MVQRDSAAGEASVAAPVSDSSLIRKVEDCSDLKDVHGYDLGVVTSQTGSTNSAPPSHDLFICHASEDKEHVARPLAQALIDRGLKVWLDELELTIGDSLSGQIEAALALSRFGIVVLSPAFFAKKWPQRELAGLAAREVDAGSKVILPVWHQVDHHYIAQRSPILADRLGAQTSAGLDDVAEKISLALARPNVRARSDHPTEPVSSRNVIPRPTASADRTHGRLIGIAALGLLSSALAGFAIARGAQGETPLSLTANTSNRAIEISFPTTWHRISTPPATLGVQLGEPLTLTSASPTSALTVGSTKTTSTTLLPASLLSELPRLPRPEVVRLADQTFYRYRNVVPTGASGAETVYAQPTTGGVILGLCVLPRVPSVAVSADCERILGSLKLTSTKPMPFGPNAAYAAALTGAISKLNSARASAGTQMAHATNPAHQAGAAERLAEAYRQAMDPLQHTIPGPLERTANTVIVSSLRRVAGGYTSMAVGARAQRASEFSRGGGAVAAGTAALASAFADLTKLGFRFGR